MVWIEFGINVGTELSDYKTKGHYGVVWNVDLGNVVVIPLSSRETTGSELTYDLGIIEGLNEKEDTHSYLKIDAIRSISKRRIGRMNNKESGKITLSNDKIDLIKKALVDSFIN
ncbi:MAG: type II toxin-antitoxin system PemK/MazF family toxin [Bacilli bacterium]|nr:type II toxin-antitoxin system PemK/MazF family toxin [Bacilli bacterium]